MYSSLWLNSWNYYNICFTVYKLNEYMSGQLIVAKSSRKSVGAENNADAETYGHKKEPDYSGSFSFWGWA